MTFAFWSEVRTSRQGAMVDNTQLINDSVDVIDELML